MLDLFLQQLILYKNVRIIKWKFFEIVYNIWMRFNFLENCRSSQQTFVGLEDVFKMSSKHVLKTSSRCLQNMSWRRLQHVFSVTILRLPRRLGRRKIVKLKTSSKRLEGMSWRSLEDMSWRYLEDMPWRILEDIMETKKKTLSGDICI